MDTAILTTISSALGCFAGFYVARFTAKRQLGNEIYKERLVAYKEIHLAAERAYFTVGAPENNGKHKGIAAVYQQETVPHMLLCSDEVVSAIGKYGQAIFINEGKETAFKELIASLRSDLGLSSLHSDTAALLQQPFASK